MTAEVESVEVYGKDDGVQILDTESDEIIKKNSFAHSVQQNVIGILGEGNANTYKIISSAGLTKIELTQKLTKGSTADEDNDGIYDWDEVCINAIETIKDYNIKDGILLPNNMPSLLECMTYYNKHGKGYVGKGFEKYMNENNSNPHHVLNFTCILPINSDPTSIDSDDDGFLDNAYVNYYENVDEKDKITYEWVKQSDEFFNVSDPNPLKKEIVWQWPLLDTKGNKVSRISSGFYEYSSTSGNYHSAIDISSTDKNDVVHDDYQVVAAYDGVLKCVKKINGGGCGIEIEHTINGKKYISRYIHMKFYDDEDGNSNHEFVQYINKIFVQRGENKSFLNDVWDKPDVSEYRIYVKAGTPIGIASGTNYNASEGKIYR